MKLYTSVLIALFLLFFPSFVLAQHQHEQCGTMDHLEMMQENHPGLARQMEEMEHATQQWIAQNPSNQNRAVVTIPVVVHVVYNTAAENISDAQILSQIDVLNEDFRRTNADAINTPSAFQSLAADVEIEFCLATIDPNGNPTNGITRTSTNVTSFSANDAMKFNSGGGKDIWPRDDYLNMWVCDLSGGLLGYAQFPGQSASTDGVVMDYQYFGRIGTATFPFDEGRTTTHEVGHWLNLRHIWGDGNCSVDDFVSDTPVQGGPNSGCPSYPSPSCTAPSDMFMNYMDYSYDGCMNMFSLGQKARMLASLNTTRAALLNSDKCGTSTELDDAGVSDITDPAGNQCGTTVSPQIVITNFGQNNLTSVTINYDIDGGPNNTFNWTGNLTTNGSATVTLPPLTSTIGSHIFNASTSNPNGITDQNPSNDDESEGFTITVTPGTVVLSSPANNASNQVLTPTLLWNTLANASTYDVEVSTNTGFSSIVASSTGSSQTSFVVSPALTGNTTYYWRVRGNNACGSGNYSSVRSFTTGNIVAPPCTEAILDGGFESGAAGAWTESSTNDYTLIDDPNPRTGTYSAWLGGANNENSQIFQSVSIPANAISATLDFHYAISSSDFCNYDFGYVLIDGTALQTYNLCGNTSTNGTYVQATQIDLISYAGSTIEVRFQATCDVSFASSFYVDDVELEICVPTPIGGGQVNCGKDAFEPNDDQSTASNLFQGAIAGFNDMLICPSNDTDWFSFYLTKNKVASIKLQNLPDNYELELYNSQGTLLDSSYNIGTSNETITFSPQVNNTYYIKVFGRQGANSTNQGYSLNVSVAKKAIGTTGTKPPFITPFIRVDNEAALSLAPNPTRGACEAIFYNPQASEIHITLIDVYGKLVYKKRQNAIAGENRIDLGTSTLSEGIYFVSIDNGATQLSERLLVTK